MLVDRRILPGIETIEEAKKEIASVLKEAMEKDPELILETKSMIEIEASEVPENETIVEALVRAYEKILQKQ